MAKIVIHKCSRRVLQQLLEERAVEIAREKGYISVAPANAGSQEGTCFKKTFLIGDCSIAVNVRIKSPYLEVLISEECKLRFASALQAIKDWLHGKGFTGKLTLQPI